ncbi:MAG: threonine synthase [Rhodospirillaceae bacterium]|nr:threonine synthase [Rhodospirillaceae bacterium]
MRYRSTRGEAQALDFEGVLLAGLAGDGGLYLPEHWPSFDREAQTRLPSRSYTELAQALFEPFVGNTILPADLAVMLDEAYAVFDDPDVAPMREIEPGLHVMELFHGPTLAFKDVALQLVGRLFDHVLAKRRKRITIVGATSGDTGSAAIEACRDREAIDIFILHPKGRVSEVQRRQMTTVKSVNVHNIAIEGSFDDCQDLVKAMFNDRAFRAEMSLSAVNSINWARIMAQIVYYARGALMLSREGGSVDFAVPTGNFGNVYAGYAAKRMGFPIGRLIVASNRNDILTRFFESGTMAAETVVPTLSPSMDIQVSSNFERLLYDLCDGDGAKVARLIAEFRKTGRFSVEPAQLAQARAIFDSVRIDDEGTKAEMARLYRDSGMLVDPHSAIGIAAGRAHKTKDGTPVIALATAHPAKFPDAVEAATGVRPALPHRLADLLQREERLTVLPNDLTAIEAHVRAHRRAGEAA